MTLTSSILSPPPSRSAGSGELAASLLSFPVSQPHQPTAVSNGANAATTAGAAVKAAGSSPSGWSYSDAKSYSFPSVVSSGLLPSAALSVAPTAAISSVSGSAGIAHIPLSLARRHLSSVSSDAVSHRLRQQALVAQLTGAFVSWQQHAVDEYSQLLQRCKRDANSAIAQLNRRNAELTRAAKEAEAAKGAAVGNDSNSVQPRADSSERRGEDGQPTDTTAADQPQPFEEKRSSISSVAAGRHGSSSDDAVPEHSSAASTEPQLAEALALQRQEAAAQAVQQLSTAIGLHALPSDCQPALLSLQSALLPWLAERSTLAARVQSIKHTQAALQAEKARLTAWKDALKHKQQQQRQQGGDSSEGGSAEQAAVEGRQWEAAKQQLAADGAKLKDEHSGYEKRIAEYKAEEASIKQSWANVQRKANGDEQSSEPAPLPTADKLSALIDGLETLTRANEQLQQASQQRAAAAQQQQPTQQQPPSQQQRSSPSQQEPRVSAQASEAAAEAPAAVQHFLGQSDDAVAALSAATRKIAEQQRQLSELTRQLAAAKQVEHEHNTHAAAPHSSAPVGRQGAETLIGASNEAVADQADKAVRLSSSLLTPPALSSSPIPSPAPSTACSSCDALLARCAALDASLSSSAAQLSAVTARLSSERDRHAAVEAEWLNQQSKLGASTAGLSSAAEREIARHTQQASERQLQLEDLSRLLDDTVKKANRELSDSRASQQRLMEEAVSALERQQANERQQWAQQLEASEAAASSQSAAREAVELQLAEEQRRWRETDAQLTEQRAAFEALRTEAAEALAARDGLLAQLAAATADIERLHALVEAERQRAGEAEAERDAAVDRMQEEQKRRKEFQFKYEDAKGKVRVYARVRPFTAAEVAAKERTLLRPGRNDWTLELNETQRDVLGHITDKWRDFAFDHVFHAGLLPGTKGNGSQVEVFNETAAFAELSLQGINCCVFAYGQSGTGKTWTMAGAPPTAENGHSRDLLGLKPRMIERVFELAAELAPTHTVSLSCYLVEIYLNALEDLFWKQDTATAMRGKEGKWPEAPELKVRADGAKKKVQVDNVRVKSFSSAADMLAYCDAAERLRRVRKTGLNEASSRSHLVFAIMSECTSRQTGKTVRGKLSLVDLAGSERADKTNVDGLSKASRDAMLEEGVAINESLRMLKNVFRILGTAHLPLAKGQKAEIVQYRGNMLTELMQDSLGGNAKTLMFVNVGPAASNISESIDSLQYGDFVKNITNDKATADEDYTEQIRRLKEVLQSYKDKYGELDT